MRTANLARAVIASDPAATALVLVATAAAGVACGSDVPWMACDASVPGVWAGVIGAFRPSLVVFDSVLPGTWADDATPRAFVWRRTVGSGRHERSAEIELARMRVIVVPHERRDFDERLPLAFAGKTVFTGPIVRLSDADGLARVRRRYGLVPGEPLITSLLVGRGLSTRWLFDMVIAAHPLLRERLPTLQHVVVGAPSSDRVTALRSTGLTLVESEPDLVHLLAQSELVVTEASESALQEVRQAHVPALLFPTSPRASDQQARARRVVSLGLARTASRQPMEAAVDALVALATDSTALAEMRTAAQADRLATGNARAAAALLWAAQ